MQVKLLPSLSLSLCVGAFSLHSALTPRTFSGQSQAPLKWLNMRNPQDLIVGGDPGSTHCTKVFETAQKDGPWVARARSIVWVRVHATSGPPYSAALHISQIRMQFQILEPDKTRGSCGRKRRRLAASLRSNWASRRAEDENASRSSFELEVQIAKYAVIGGVGAQDIPTRV